MQRAVLFPPFLRYKLGKLLTVKSVRTMIIRKIRLDIFYSCLLYILLLSFIYFVLASFFALKHQSLAVLCICHPFALLKICLLSVSSCIFALGAKSDLSIFNF